MLHRIFLIYYLPFHENLIIIYISKFFDEREGSLQEMKSNLQEYEKKFKALADEKRLEILLELSKRGETCVCDLTETFNISQSKLSYHLKILYDAGFITKQSKGTWSYYNINEETVNELLSEELRGLFKKTEMKSTHPSCC